MWWAVTRLWFLTASIVWLVVSLCDDSSWWWGITALLVRGRTVRLLVLRIIGMSGFPRRNTSRLGGLALDIGIGLHSSFGIRGHLTELSDIDYFCLDFVGRWGVLMSFMCGRLLPRSRTIIVVVASHTIIARRRNLTAWWLLLGSSCQIRIYKQLLLNSHLVCQACIPASIKPSVIALVVGTNKIRVNPAMWLLTIDYRVHSASPCSYQYYSHTLLTYLASVLTLGGTPETIRMWNYRPLLLCWSSYVVSCYPRRLGCLFVLHI